MENDPQKDRLGVSTTLKGPAKLALEALAAKRNEGPNSTLRVLLETVLPDPNIEAILAGASQLEAPEKSEKLDQVLNALTEFRNATAELKAQVDIVAAREPPTLDLNPIVERHAQLTEKVDAALKTASVEIHANTRFGQELGQSVGKLTERFDLLAQRVEGIKIPTVDLAPVANSLTQLTKVVEEANKRPVIAPDDLTKVKDEVQKLADRPAGASRLTVIVTGAAIIVAIIGVGLWTRPNMSIVSKLGDQVGTVAADVKKLDARITATDARVEIEDKAMVKALDEIDKLRNQKAPPATSR